MTDDKEIKDGLEDLESIHLATKREGHFLYKRWEGIKMRSQRMIDPLWQRSFTAFVEHVESLDFYAFAVEDEESGKAKWRLLRIDESLPWEPGNVRWKSVPKTKKKRVSKASLDPVIRPLTQEEIDATSDRAAAVFDIVDRRLATSYQSIEDRLAHVFAEMDAQRESPEERRVRLEAEMEAEEAESVRLFNERFGTTGKKESNDE